MKPEHYKCMKRRTALTLLFGVLTTMTAWATNPPVSYIDMDGVTQQCDNYTLLDGSEILLGEVGSADYWYVVDGTVNYDHRIELCGNVHIILKDGAVMNIDTKDRTSYREGLGFSNSHYFSINIYGQSTGSNNGQLIINSGYNCIMSCGRSVNITSARVTANAHETSGSNCYAIYATDNDPSINIKNATVNATSYGSSIYARGASINIDGGQVTATSINGSGMRAEKSGADGTGLVTLTNATVIVTGYQYGIYTSGAKSDAEDYGLIINSGIVTATCTGGSSYYDIYADGGNIVIKGGQVTAKGNNGIYSRRLNYHGGDITLGCTAATDYILATQYNSNRNLTIVSGKTLYDGIGGSYTGNVNSRKDEMANKMLRLTNDVLLTEETGVSNLSGYTGAANVNVVFSRQFTVNMPSTICMPFPMTSIAGGKVYAFAGIENDETDGWVATMIDATPDDGNLVTATNVGTPYLFMPSATDVTFTGTIAEGGESYTPGTTTVGDWQYIGTYTGEQWAEAPAAVYGFSAQTVAADGISQGEFVKVGAKVRIRPLRAYMTYVGSGTPPSRGMKRAESLTEEQLPERIRVRLVGANGEVTGIGTINTHTGSVVLSDEAWYSLDGVRLNSKPTAKGIYIYKGKKVKR